MADTPITAVDQVSVGKFVRFVDRDKSGRFSYTGEVITVEKETKTKPSFFEMLTFEGIMGFSFPKTLKDKDEVITGGRVEEATNELYTTTTKPKGWAKFKKNPVVYKEAEAVVEPIKTKKEQVFELVAANPRKKEASLLKLAKKEIGGSDTRLTSFIRLALAKQ